MGLVLGLDAGTQSLKGLLVDPEAGTIVARASRPLELLPGLAPGRPSSGRRTGRRRRPP